MEFKRLTYSTTEGVARIALNTPEKLNALDTEVWFELGDAFDAALADRTVNAIILAGEGRAFSSGFDISKSRVQLDMEMYDQWLWLHHQREVMLKIWNSYKPVVCAVQSYCLGGAFELANLADMIIAADDAVFGEIELRYSMVPQPALAYLIGVRKAKEILFLTENFDAQEAYRIGLVNRVVPRDELEDTVMAIAKKLAKMPVETLRMTKKLINRALDAQGYELVGDWGWDDFLLSKNMPTEISKEFDRVHQTEGLKAAYRYMSERFK